MVLKQSVKNKIGYYVVFIHFFLAFVLVKSDFIERVRNKCCAEPIEITRHYRTMLGNHIRIDKSLTDGFVVFIGDSHTQGLATSEVAMRAVNWGIGNDTTVGVLERLSYYESLSRASAIVLAIGYNDLRFRDNPEIISNLDLIISRLPSSIPIIVNAIHPVGVEKGSETQKRIMEINSNIKQIVNRYSNVTHLDAFQEHLTDNGFLRSDLLVGDDVHLSKEGYEIWIDKLSNTLKIVNLKNNKWLGKDYAEANKQL